MVKTRLAVFDIDGTIFRSSLVVELSRALVAAGIFPKTALREMSREYLAWLDRKGTYQAYINRVVEIYNRRIAGQSLKRARRVAAGVIAQQKDRVYRFSRDLIKQCRRQNYFLAAISGSPSYIVELYARGMGFDWFCGTELEVAGGKFTGRVANLDPALRKDKVIRQLVGGYPALNLSRSLAVGDTESDIAMLKLVGRPIAFNPNQELAAAARRHGWRLVVERKDMIYEIRDFRAAAGRR
ncbi:MAG TPA: HAD-IB family phosphatase [Patescibacteria group bacterium]|nr:HAD-IB family phosphatase [Patescibacteria group bacterium]